MIYSQEANQVPENFNPLPSLNNVENIKKPTSKKLVLVLGGLILVLAIFSGAYLIWESDVFSKAPYKENNLISGLASKISEIETSSFELSYSLIGQDRDSDAKPFTFTGALRKATRDTEMIPEDIDIDVSLKAKSDISNSSNDIELNLFANANLGDMVTKVDIDLIKKTDNYYLKINNFPSVLMSALPVPKGKWILFSDDYVFNEIKEISYPSKENFKALISFALKSAEQNTLIKVASDPKKERNNEQIAYKYSLKINTDGLNLFLNDLINEIKKGTFGNQYKEYEYEIEEFIEFTKGKEFKEIVEYYNSNTDSNLWIDSDGFPIKLETAIRLVPSSKRLSDRQFTLTYTISLKDINKETKINSPSDYKNITDYINPDVYLNSMNEARNEGKDAAIKSNMVRMRVSAEMVYDQVGGYGTKAFPLGTCRNEPGTLFSDQSMNNTISTINSIYENGQTMTCVSSGYSGAINSWAISAPLITEPNFSYCVDSTGAAKEMGGSLTTDRCPSANIDSF